MTTNDALTKEEFMRRCETIWNKGYARPKLFRLMFNWLDAVMRLEHTMFSDGQTQGKSWFKFLNAEYRRTEQGQRTLAGDAEGYELQCLAAILSHPCQSCAESEHAWHTRPGFCEHKEPQTDNPTSGGF
jgi:hypothetical protein